MDVTKEALEEFNIDNQRSSACYEREIADLKQQRDDLLGICKELMEKADDGSAAFDDPVPGSIYLRAEAAIAKAKT